MKFTSYYFPHYSLLILLFLIIFTNAYAMGQNNKMNILFISSFSKELPAQVSMEKGLNDKLGYKQGNHTVYYEFLNNPNLPEDYHISLASYLEKKYESLTLDYIVAWGSSAANFLLDHSDIFTDARRIYLEITEQTIRDAQFKFGNEILISSYSDFHESLSEAVRLTNPEKIIVIGTTTDASGKTRIMRFKKTHKKITENIEIEYILNTPLDQVKAKLSKLPAKKTMIYYLLMFNDGKGTIMTPYAIVQELVKVTKIPIFSHWESLINSGIVGGNVLSLEKTGSFLGQTLLSPKNTESIITFSPMRYVYDWNSIKRSRISPKKLPRDALVINKPESFIELYKYYIISGIIILIIQSFSIFLLIINRSKLLKTEDALRNHRDHLEELVDERTKKLKESEQLYRTIFETVPDSLFIANFDGKTVEANPAACKQYRYSREELINIHSNQLISPEDQDHLPEFIKALKESGKFQGETVDVRKDGTTFNTEVHGAVIHYKGHPHMLAIIRDITKRIQMETQLKASLQEKETLMKEILHRTKNNMNTIISLLKLQSFRIMDKKILMMFDDIKNRILSMLLVQQQLYQTKQFVNLDLKDYLKNLSNTIYKNLNINSENISLKFNLVPITVSPDTAIPCGLILNELLTNAFKYAFPDGRHGEITISLTGENKDIKLTISDNGIGIPHDLNIKTINSLGLQLINSFVIQIDGSYELSRENGTTWTIRFKA